MRGRFRFREHKLTPDTDVPVVYVMRCQVCGLAGPGSEDATDGTRWAAGHLKESPGHLHYQEHITRSYTFEPGAWL